MKRCVLAIALILLLVLGGCKKPPLGEQAALDQVVEEAGPKEPINLPETDLPSEEKAPAEEQQTEAAPEEEPKEETKEEVPAIPMTVQQVVPLKGRIHTLSAEDQKTVEALLERQEWGLFNHRYQPSDFKIVVGEQTYSGFFEHGTMDTAEHGTNLNKEDLQTLLQILEKYFGVYEGAPTVEPLTSEAPRKVMSQEDWLTAKSIWSHASEEETWGPIPSTFRAEFLLAWDTFGYYYDSTQGMISMGLSAKQLPAKEQAALEQVLSKYGMMVKKNTVVIKPISIQKVHPQEGEIFTLAAEDAAALLALVEQNEWKAGSFYSIPDIEWTVGKEVYSYTSGTGTINASSRGMKLDLQTTFQVNLILEKYLKTPCDLPTVARMARNPLCGRTPIEQEDVDTVNRILYRCNSQGSWEAAPSGFVQEIQLISYGETYYYDSAKNLIFHNGQTTPLEWEEYTRLERVISKYMKPLETGS